MGASPYILGLRAKLGHDLVLMPGVTVIVRRQRQGRDEILLARRSDNAEWTPITGCCDPGEDVDTSARRECLEEAGVEIAIERIVALETLPVSTYPNGDQCQFFDVCLLAHPVGGLAHVADDENTDVRWFALDDMPELSPRFARQLDLALSDDPRPAFGADSRRYSPTIASGT